ncbi:MAG: tRNA pseudouridine synthase A, partial [Bacillota bacterium]|nr:tRNA pseudouridine synthase A [Bacillota bacterium]
MNYLLVIAYDGSDFAGWQTQDPDAHQTTRTVQGELERILRRVFRLPIDLQGSGRTDRGAHATGQTASFHLPIQLTGDDLMRILGDSLPHDISVLSATVVPDRFHARYDATGKTYVYKIRNAHRQHPFVSRYTHYVPIRRHRIDADAMRRAASLFIGTHDFGSFMAMGSDKKNTVRTIFSFDISEYPIDPDD